MPDRISLDPLDQMLRSIASQRRTGVLQVEQLGEREVEQGKIYFERGHPVLASSAHESGDAAFMRIRTWKHVTCSFEGISSRYPLPSIQGERQTGPVMKYYREPAQTGKLRYLPQAQAEEQRTHRISESLPPLLPALPAAGQATQSASTAPPRSRTRSFGAQREQTESSDPAPVSGTAALPLTPLPEYQQKSAVTAPLEQISSHTPLPGRSAIFRAKVEFANEKYIQRMERRQRIIFILLDGYRTIQNIAYLTNYTENEVEMVLMRLTKYGYTEQVFEPSCDSTLDKKMIDLFSLH